MVRKATVAKKAAVQQTRKKGEPEGDVPLSSTARDWLISPLLHLINMNLHAKRTELVCWLNASVALVPIAINLWFCPPPFPRDRHEAAVYTYPIPLLSKKVVTKPLTVPSVRASFPVLSPSPQQRVLQSYQNWSTTASPVVSGRTYRAAPRQFYTRQMTFSRDCTSRGVVARPAVIRQRHI